MAIVDKTEISGYPLVSQGKVRDIYEIEPDKLLIVTTDRMSAFDIVLPDPIPYKGMVLNQLTVFWMEKFRDIVNNHLLETEVRHFPSGLQPYADSLQGRSVLVRKANPLPVECIVRGYISGSGWRDYQNNCQVCGIDLPEGLRESDPLPFPIFTPSTKAEAGGKDENITLEQAKETLGEQALEEIKDYSLQLYQRGDQAAETAGIIIADTKFEFGIYKGETILIDEVLTPDSSRFWPMDSYTPGQSQPSFDKQYLRDWLSQNWDLQGEPPRLPEEVIQTTSDLYQEAYRRLTGRELF